MRDIGYSRSFKLATNPTQLIEQDNIETSSDRTETQLSLRVEFAIILLILVVAAFLRFYQIGVVPAGLSHDEAFNGVDATLILEGQRPVFLESNNGREPLYIYLQALSILLFGLSPFALHLVSSSIGLATVGTSWLLFRKMFNPLVGLLAAAFVAVGFWHVMESRIALRAIMLPFILTVIVYFLWLALERKRPAYWLFAGLFTGIGAYTYSSFRFFPVVIVLFIAFQLISRKHYGAKQLVLGLLVVTVVALIVFAPMGIYIVQNSDSFFRRAGQINDFRFIMQNGNFGPLIEDSLNTLWMFSFRGDPSSRYNLALRPLFDPIMSLFFYVGLIMAIRLWREPRYQMALLWLVVMLVPVAITGESPQFFRGIGAMPVVYIFPALGLLWVIGRIQHLIPAAMSKNRIIGLGATAIVIWSGIFTFRDYFVVWANNTEARTIYNASLAESLSYLKQRGGNEPVLFSTEYAFDLDRFVVDILSGHRPPAITWFNGKKAIPFAAKNEPLLYVFTATAMPDKGLLDNLFPAGSLEKEALDPEGKAAYRVYRLAGIPQTLADKKPLYRFDDQLDLLDFAVGNLGQNAGKTVVEPDSDLPVTLVWRVTAKPKADYSFFSHVIGGWSSMWAQNDGNGYPTPQWQVGDILVAAQDVYIWPGTPPGEYQLTVGAYSRSDGSRLQVTKDGKLAGDQAELPSISVVKPKVFPADLKRLGYADQVAANLDDKVELLGYTLGREEAKPGEVLDLTLFWRTKARLDKRYTVFTHLVDDSGKVWGQRDNEPYFGFYPTTDWDQGEVIKDKYGIEIKPDTPDGTYQIEVGMYDGASGQRLNVLGGLRKDNKVLLKKVRISK